MDIYAILQPARPALPSTAARTRLASSETLVVSATFFSSASHGPAGEAWHGRRGQGIKPGLDMGSGAADEEQWDALPGRCVVERQGIGVIITAGGNSTTSILVRGLASVELTSATAGRPATGGGNDNDDASRLGEGNRRLCR